MVPSYWLEPIAPGVIRVAQRKADGSDEPFPDSLSSAYYENAPTAHGPHAETAGPPLFHTDAQDEIDGGDEDTVYTAQVRTHSDKTQQRRIVGHLQYSEEEEEEEEDDKETEAEDEDLEASGLSSPPSSDADEPPAYAPPSKKAR
ncbi:hypothetical protein FN846DRAFT_893234 [Sphaerosporella brunnea]|uniref:Uncharacterized protein n=1 Tax=Sphaerosporella brunnea TaxID=1250544 RepID=A0A5J5EMN5_9PEZI|nr:hypothetical protein FN846DRAFT_893234 [Sphaerosporella brunnea]